MAIYLDTNALYRWPTFTELDRLALSVVASQLSQAILVPSLVVDEAAAHRRRALEAVIAAHTTAADRLERAFGTEDIHVEPYPDVDGAMATWHRRLRQFARIIETTPSHAMEGLQREISGRPPAKPRETPPNDDARKGSGRRKGAGARDAAIWMTIVEDVRARREHGYLISKDQDFGRDGRLFYELRDEIEPYSLELHAEVASFVSRIGERAEGAITLQDLDELAASAVCEAVDASSEVGAATWSGDRIPHVQSTRVSTATPLAILRASEYRPADGATPITVADTTWEVKADLLYKNSDDPLADDEWYVLQGLTLDAAVQVYVQDRRAEVIGFQIRASPTAFLSDDGRVLIMRTTNPDL